MPRLAVVAALTALTTAAHAGAAGTVTGTVRFAGAAPARGHVHRDTDPYCAGVAEDDAVVVIDGKVNQKACTYTPHAIDLVIGRAGHVVEIACDVHSWMHAVVQAPATLTYGAP